MDIGQSFFFYSGTIGAPKPSIIKFQNKSSFCYSNKYFALSIP